MRISDWSSDVCSSDFNAQVAKLIASYTDDALAALMTNLGGHCLETLTDAFDRAADDVPTMFIAYTIKGFGLPFAGHKDNHAGLMNPTQIAALRDQFGIAEGGERSEEHTSELQSLMRISYAVFCLKKKNQDNISLHE